MRRFALQDFFICILIVPFLPVNMAFAIAGESIRTARHPVGVQQKKSTTRTRPTPEAIWKGIKSAAQSEVRSSSPLITAPFSVKQTGSSRQITIVRDAVGELGLRGEPYDLPFKKQILIEALRRSLTETDMGAPAAKEGTSAGTQGSSEAESYWQPYLLRAEGLVKKIVVDIETNPDKTSSKGKLQEYERQIDEIIYVEIYQAVERDAQRKGYNVIYGRGDGDRKKFSVSLSTAPDGAKVWIMTGLVYRKQLIMKTDPSQWPWTEIVQNPVELLGGYHYRAVWPGGKRAEADIVVDSANPITLKPE